MVLPAPILRLVRDAREKLAQQPQLASAPHFRNQNRRKWVSALDGTRWIGCYKMSQGCREATSP